jgi:hypothetical protein
VVGVANNGIFAERVRICLKIAQTAGRNFRPAVWFAKLIYISKLRESEVMMISRYLSVGLLSLLMLGVLGCGSGGEKVYKVSGTVKFADGTPLTQGTVMFVKEGFQTQGNIDEKGNYALSTYNRNDGAPLGEYKIYLTGEAEGIAPDYKPLVAKKFLNAGTSGLILEVKAQSNTYDIVVEKP